MIEIKKNNVPQKLIAYQKTQYASYNNMPKDVYIAVLNSLMQEQGYLCAYCMCRIPQERKTPPVSIEHIEPQSSSSIDQTLNYYNMLAVCNGNRGCGSKKNMTCDAKRGNTKLTINPLISSTLSSIRYKSNGVIYSTQEEINTDLNETLNLNNEQSHLVGNRLSALQTMLSELKDKLKDRPKENIIPTCLKLLNKYQYQSKKTPYVGILIWWLQKKVNRKSK